jgi:hypothetical protein
MELPCRGVRRNSSGCPPLNRLAGVKWIVLSVTLSARECYLCHDGSFRMLIYNFTETLWPCLKSTLGYLTEKRNELAPEYTIRAGMNFCIILGSACFIEGILEAYLRAILRSRRLEFNRIEIPELELRRALNTYYHRIEHDLAERIGRSLGAQGYDEMVELLVGTRLSQLGKVAPLWEDITVLFNFRNVLAHGREVSARQFRGATVPDGFKEEFSGSYKKVEGYLQKKGLLSSRFVEAHNEYLFFADAVADHFRQLALALPDAFANSLPALERTACLTVMQQANAG